jgi:hypothetical protein
MTPACETELRLMATLHKKDFDRQCEGFLQLKIFTN